jgi:hypothetical protein
MTLPGNKKNMNGVIFKPMKSGFRARNLFHDQKGLSWLIGIVEVIPNCSHATLFNHGSATKKKFENMRVFSQLSKTTPRTQNLALPFCFQLHERPEIN